jgi:iron complex transport system ATP-binding protein
MATPLLELRDVGFTYGSSDGRARAFSLSEVSVAVAPGEIVGVIGPNSAGKTTLIRLVTRVVRPTSGAIRLNGDDLASLSPWALARAVAVVPQEAPVGLRFSVEQLALMGRYPHSPSRFFESAEDREVARAAMAATGVLPLAALPVERLSGGERQRALLARALAQAPQLLVLDEPTAHLDLRYQVECARLLARVNREQGMGVLLVSHDLTLAAQLCDRLLVLAEGRVVRLGPPAEVLDAALLEAVYGCAVRVERAPAPEGLQVQVVWPGRG